MENALMQNQFLHPIVRTLEKITGPVCWIDGEGHIVHFNDALIKLTGFTAKRLRSASLQLLEPGLDSTSLIERLKSLHKNHPVDWKTEFINAEGTRYPVCLQAIKMDIDGMSLMYLQVKPQEEGGASREELLSACLTEHKIAAWEWDLTSHTLRASDFFYEFFGLNKAQQVSLANFLSLMKPHLSGTQMEDLKKAMAEIQKRPFSFEQELVLHHRDGREQNIRIGSQPVYRNGQPILLRGHFQLISIAAEHRAETLARKLMALSPQLIFWVNSNLSIRYANPAALQALGLTEHELSQGLQWPNLCSSPSEMDWTSLFKEKTDDRKRKLPIHLLGKNKTLMSTICHFELIEIEYNSMLHISAQAVDQNEDAIMAQHHSTLLESMRLSRKLDNEKINLQKELSATHKNILTLNDNYMEFLKNLDKASKGTSPVLLIGKDENSKKLLARTIHLLSDQSDDPLVKIDCSRLSQQSLEKELFGYEKSLYGVTTEEFGGRIEKAEGGTLLLDNIYALSPAIQDKLNWLLEEGKYERIGSKTTRTANVRVVGTTEQDLSTLVAAGIFSKDLFAQLNKGFVYHLPLEQHYNEDIAISLKDIGYQQVNTTNLHLTESNAIEPDEPLISLEEKQKQHILNALRLTGGKVSGKNGAAQILDIHPQTLFSKMRKLGIKYVEMEKQ